jgi:hypothetical protein
MLKRLIDAILTGADIDKIGKLKACATAEQVVLHGPRGADIVAAYRLLSDHYSDAERP